MILIGFNAKTALTRHRFQVLFTLHDCMHTPEENLFEAEIHFLNNLLMGQFFLSQYLPQYAKLLGEGEQF